MEYLRECWYVAGFAGDVSREPISRTFLDEEIALYRDDDGVPVALGNRCPHRFAPLDKGRVVDGALQCPYHGMRFDRTGACALVPCGGKLPPHARVKSYPIVDRYQLLWIWMGDAARADPDLIPDFAYLEDEAFGWFNGTLYARANYQLLVDNLLDLSHAEFLHPLLSSNGWASRNQAKIEQSERSVRVHNLAADDNVLPIMLQMMPEIERVGTTVQHERWEAPSLLHLSVEYYATNGEIIIPSGHFLTPETAGTTHYFIRGGQGIAPASADFTAGMQAGVLAIFEQEDIPIVESQQRYLGDRDLMDATPAILQTDAGAVRARRLLVKLIREERKMPPPGLSIAAE